MKLFSLFVVVFTGVFVSGVYAEALPATWEGQAFLNRSAVQNAESSASIPAPLADQIDQNQPSAAAYMAAFSQGDLAQSFQQTNTNISGAGIGLHSGIGSSDNVTIQLWAGGLPNASGTMLVEASATGTAGEWVDVFWSPVTVVPGTTYYLVFTGNTTLGIDGDLNNPYPYGCVYANSGYNEFPNYDYTFRTYYDDGTSLTRYTWGSVKTSF